MTARAWLLTLVLAIGCGPAVSDAYKALDATASTLDASARAFEQFDHDHQLAIVAADKAAGKAPAAIDSDLQAYRAKRAAVTKAFADVGAAVVAGRALLPLVEAGVKKQTDLTTWLQLLLQAAADAQTALRLLGFGG